MGTDRLRRRPRTLAGAPLRAPLMGDREPARSRAARASEIFERQGAPEAVAQARELLDSL